MSEREFADVRQGNHESGEALTVENFLAELEVLQNEIAVEKNRVWPCVADGTLAPHLLVRLCK